MEYLHYQSLYLYEQNHWWYRVRRMLVHQLINVYLPKRTDLDILDIGCGAGLLSKELEQYGKVTGVDPSPQAVEFSRSRGLHDVRIGRAEETGSSNDQFDLVVCLDVLEHLEDDRVGVDEIKRVLRPGGVAIIFVPAFRFLWGVTDELSHHYRRYRRPLLLKNLKDAKLTLLRSSYFNSLLFIPIALVRIGLRFFQIRVKSEMESGTGLLNTIFFGIFSLERKLLTIVDMPFGVSIMYVVKK